LVDGSYLGGKLEAGDEESVRFIHPALGYQEILIDHISMILLTTPSIPSDFDRYNLKGGDNDVLYKKSGNIRGQDFIQGTFDIFTKRGLAFESSLGLLEFPLDDIEAMILSQAETDDPFPSQNVTLVFKDRSGVLNADMKQLKSGVLRFSTIFGKEITVKKEMLDSIIFKNDRICNLSSIQPEKVVQTPYIGESKSFLFPWRTDRSVTGDMLTSKGRIFAKGLGLHSRTSLTYKLDKKFSALEAWAGICDEVLKIPAEGSVLFLVEGDGKILFKSPVIKGDSDPIRFPRLDLSELSSITLTVDFADNFDSGDRAFIGNPVLIKK